jgi:hypothetical protein
LQEHPIAPYDDDDDDDDEKKRYDEYGFYFLERARHDS